jgi:Big-like domain-containing protein
VLGANPGDTLQQLLVTGTAASGTPTAVGTQLLYTATTLPVSGADQFPYRVTKADGTSIDAIARVRVYPPTGPNSLITCTRNSVINNGALNRTNSAPCAFYAEVVTRISANGFAATVKYLVARPSGGAAPKAAVFLVGGGDLDMSIAGNATSGVPSGAGGNFLVRTMQLFADAGYLAITLQRPSDVPTIGVADPAADIDLYRISVRHAVDILTILREENTDNLPLFIAGTSRGAMSVVASNLIATGVSISSPVTVPTSDPAMVFVGDPRFPSLQPSFVQRPSHVLWNTSDLCQFTPPANSQALLTSLQNAGVAAEGRSVTGGFVFDNGTGIDQCGGLSPHQFLGIEKTQTTPTAFTGAATVVTAWLDSRIVALGGDRHPDASFATLTTASGAPLSIDLSTLARDLDGDPLAYTLSHASTALGGGVSLSGSTVTYTPPAGVTSGTDYFVYVVTDGRGGVGAAVITVKIGG